MKNRNQHLLDSLMAVEPDEHKFWARVLAIGIGKLTTFVASHRASDIEMVESRFRQLVLAGKALMDEAERISDLETISYEEYLQTSAWQARRQEALLAARWQCSTCGNADDLEVHHRTYARRGNERADDLEVLCTRCHRERHDG